MLFSKRLELAKEYYLWIDSHKEKFIVRDCPENVIAFLDSKGMFAEKRPLVNRYCINYIDVLGSLKTICPFGMTPKVGSFGCTGCSLFISNDTTRNIVVCEGEAKCQVNHLGI